MDNIEKEPKAKKTYEKPVLIKVELVTKEAVLGNCKTGIVLVCQQVDLTCSSQIVS